MRRLADKLGVIVVTFVSLALCIGALWPVIACLNGSCSGAGPEVALPMLAIVGVLVLLLALALVAIAFHVFGLSDQRQALALPEGSVRAVIALSLIVLFAVVSIYLYVSLSASGGITQLNGVTRSEKDGIAAKFANEKIDVLYVLPNGVVNRDPKSDKAAYTIGFRRTSNSTAEDLAKQLFVLIGTLVTAVSSFYFGAKTATSAKSSAADSLGATPALNMTSFSPTVWMVSSGPISGFSIAGTALGGAKSVRLAQQGQSDVVATNVVAASNLITCDFPVAASTPLGQWDIVVTDSNGKDTWSPRAVALK